MSDQQAGREAIYEKAKAAWERSYYEGGTTVRDCVTAIVDAVIDHSTDKLAIDLLRSRIATLERENYCYAKTLEIISQLPTTGDAA